MMTLKMRLRIGQVVSLLFVLTLLISLAACSNPTPEPQLAPDQIKSRALQAVGTIDTYRFDMAMTMTISGSNDAAISQQFAATGAMDKVGKEMSMDISVEMESTANPGVPALEEVKQEAEIYIIGDKMYLRVSGPGMPAEWQEQELPQELWQERDVATQQVKLLEDSELSLTGEERVKGTDSYVLEVLADVDQLWEVLKEQLQSQYLPEVREPENIFETMSVRMWIAKETFFPMRVQERMALVTSSENFGLPVSEGQFEVTMGIELELTLYDYNEDFAIETPPELR